jgi:GTP-binding protein
MASPHRSNARPAPRPPAAVAGPLDCIEANYLSEARPGFALPTPTQPEIAFAGRSNVGKSTLLNRLAQRRALARTSKTPGCTRGVVLFELCLRDGTRLHIADLPGYGFADRSKGERAAWGRHLEEYVQRRASLRAVIVLIDVRRGPQPDDLQLLEWLTFIHRDPIVVLTKIDKLSRNETAAAVASAHRSLGVPVLAVSGETGVGRDELLQRIRAILAPVEAQAGTETSGDSSPVRGDAGAPDDLGTATAHRPA